MQAKHAVVATLIVALGAIADARPSVTIRGELPFDERALNEAVELRLGDAPVVDVDVIVGRDDQGRLVVEVGGRTQTVVLMTSDPHSAARVVAMVVVELVAEPSAAPGQSAPVVAGSSAISTRAPEPRGPSKLSGRIVPALLRDDGGYTTKLLTAALAYRVSTAIRVVGTLGVGLAGKQGDRETVVPVRLGLEGSAGAIALELGAVAHPYSSRCGVGKTSSGVYGAVRMYMPVGDTARVLVEGGGDFLVDKAYSEMCFESFGYREYGGWIGAGVEWPL
jgi:hypothetical protein